MRTRFSKVWCATCASMQFAGECGHSRVEAPPLEQRMAALRSERYSWDALGRIGLRIVRDLVLPKPVAWRVYTGDHSKGLDDFREAK